MSGTAHLILAASRRAEGGAKTVHLSLIHARTHVLGDRCVASHRLFSCVVDVAGVYVNIGTDQPFPANSSHKQRGTTPNGPTLTRPLGMC